MDTADKNITVQHHPATFWCVYNQTTSEFTKCKSGMKMTWQSPDPGSQQWKMTDGAVKNSQFFL